MSGVRHEYRGDGGRATHALGPIDLTIDPGEFVVIVGPSGCGKSTLLSLLAGFIEPSEGEVLVDGSRVAGPDPSRGIVFQQPNLYPWYTVRENVALGPRLRGASKGERHAIADEHLRLVGLADFAGAKPYELSGGMQQRTQIARVLANDPQLMLLDEPFGALDAMTRERLQGELHRIWRGSGKSAVFITHSVDEAVFLGSRVLVMSPRPGRIVFDERPPFGDTERTADLRASPEFATFSAAVREQIGASLADAF
ncbi:MAG: ABC transporter ATP-binding protein [Solirubrobacteraceae bacterium]|nr:ABC transporter ATP-binding protein [Patulibacter sp.]